MAFGKGIAREAFLKTIWKGPTFQLVSVFLPEVYPGQNTDYHGTIDADIMHGALRHLGLRKVQEADILVFQGMTRNNGVQWPKDGNAMRFYMDRLLADKDGPVSLGGVGKECSEEGYELGLYRNLAKEDTGDIFPHLFYAPVPILYPRLTTLVAKA